MPELQVDLDSYVRRCWFRERDLRLSTGSFWRCKVGVVFCWTLLILAIEQGDGNRLQRYRMPGLYIHQARSYCGLTEAKWAETECKSRSYEMPEGPIVHSLHLGRRSSSGLLLGLVGYQFH